MVHIITSQIFIFQSQMKRRISDSEHTEIRFLPSFRCCVSSSSSPQTRPQTRKKTMLSFIAVKMNEKGSNCPLWNETVDDHQQIDGPTKTVMSEERRKDQRRRQIQIQSHLLFANCTKIRRSERTSGSSSPGTETQNDPVINGRPFSRHHNDIYLLLYCYRERDREREGTLGKVVS